MTDNPKAQVVSPGFATTREAYEWLATAGREKLIEESAEAFGGLTSPTYGAAPEWERVEVYEGVKRVLAVFEKAHTPTDDEREALARLVDPGAFIPFDPGVVDPRWPAEVEHRQQEARHHADRILTAGFRRSEVPEPSAEPVCEHGSPLSALCDYAARYASGETDGTAPKHAEPQGEPSDAQVLAALRAYASTPQQHGKGREDAIRAALRAAGGVR